MSTSQTPNPNPTDPLLRPGCVIEPNQSGHADPPETGHPSAENATPIAASAEPRRRRGADPPDWLPEGWIVEARERTSGVTAGLVDKYYIEQATGRRFRSKKEVLSYLETGGVMKRKKTMESTNVKKMESSETRKDPVQNFDFSNVPETVAWTLKGDTWTASIDGVEVPESTRKEWEAVLAHVFGTDSRSA